MRRNHEPDGVAAALSFVIPGLGQIYKGEIFSGILYFALVVVGYVMYIVPGILLHLVCIYGAAQPRQRRY